MRFIKDRAKKQRRTAKDVSVECCFCACGKVPVIVGVAVVHIHVRADLMLSVMSSYVAVTDVVSASVMVTLVPSLRVANTDVFADGADVIKEYH